MLTKLARAVVVVAVLTGSITAYSPLSEDLDSCHDELDRLRRAASDASDAAEEAHSKFREFDDCRRDPETYDLMGDRCHSRRSDYESARSDLESKMEDLDSRLRSVQDYCGYEFTINPLSSSDAARQHLSAAEQRLCTSYKRMLALGMTQQSLLQQCKANMSEQWCRSCLGMN